MKNVLKKALLLMAILSMLAALTVPAFAAEFDFEEKIEEFSENDLNTRTLEIGETDQPLGAIWLDNSTTESYVSDEDVITLKGKSVKAVGEGTAYVVIAAGETMYEVTCYKVVEEKESEKGFGGLLGASDDGDEGGTFSLITGGMKYFFIFFILCFGFVISIFVLIFASAHKSKKLDRAMHQLSEKPCQETCAEAAHEFSNINGMVRFNLGAGGEKNGVHFNLWREVFNEVVIPNPNIKAETKEDLRRALVRLNTHGLYTVKATRSEAENKEAAEAFGRGGEDHVWHNLKSLGCDVYRNVRIKNGRTSSEIDAVIVDPNKGIFLLEIKSVGGEHAKDGTKVISYEYLKEDPGNQIFRHEFDFKSYFPSLALDGKIRNVLTFSWPHGDTRRILNQSSFANVDYDIITVEQLIGYHRARKEVAITESERGEIALKLRACSGECIIR